MARAPGPEGASRARRGERLTGGCGSKGSFAKVRCSRPVMPGLGSAHLTLPFLGLREGPCSSAPALYPEGRCPGFLSVHGRAQQVRGDRKLDHGMGGHLSGTGPTPE